MNKYHEYIIFSTVFLQFDSMARRFTANEVVGLLECDDDEPIMQDSDNEDFLCDEGKPNN